MRRSNPIWSVIRLVGLLACVAIVAALAWGWVVSAGGARNIYLSRDATPNASAMVFLNDGALRVSHWWNNPQARPARLYAKALLGFGVHFESAVAPPNRTLIIQRFWVPIWFGMLLFLLPPLVALWRGPMRRRRRHLEGLCPQCGYNLAGNISGACTECGAICPPPTDPATCKRRRPAAQLIFTGAFTLTALVMVAAWTISYVRPFTREWVTDSDDQMVATMAAGALAMSASKIHERNLTTNSNLPSKPSRWETGLWGFDYSEYTSGVEFVRDEAMAQMAASFGMGDPPPIAVFETGWSLTLPLWIPCALAIPPWLVLLYRPLRRLRRRIRDRCAQCGNDNMGNSSKVCSECREHASSA